MKQTLAVLFGGCSSEYEVSLMSAAAVMRAVDQSRWQLVPVGITRTGQWLHFPGQPDAVEKDTWWQNPACTPALLSPSREDHGLWLLGESEHRLLPLDLVFPVMHGRFGEDGAVQGLLEMAGIPLVGCGSLSSALCMDKEIAHRLAQTAGFACPRFATVYNQDGPAAAAQQALAALSGIDFPWYVKPAGEGSSFGITRVENEGQLPAALATAFRYGPKAVVEEGIDGFEVGCAVLESENGLLTGSVDAISLSGGFFDFHEKYTLETAKILLPAPIPEETTAAVKEMAFGLWRLFGCRGLARIDLFLSTEGQLIFNEINTIPGMTPHSRYPGMMRAAGLGFEKMVALLLEGALL